MKKVRIGVLGAGRGGSMIKYCAQAENAEIVAICDQYEPLLERQRRLYPEAKIAYYTRFEDFLKHDMDAVVLANYANEHAPYAIRCLKKGLHVFSEVLPVQTLQEAVQLIEAVEESGRVYAYGENYCYMPAPYEMRRLYRQGKIGEFEYGEGEYIHNCEPIWPEITQGNPEHWRNNMYATFYCTHSIGPLLHITGLRPVRVVGFESPLVERKLRAGSKSGLFGIEMITLENGGVIKSIHGDLYENSIWYTVYGGKGRMESAREDAENGGVQTLYVKADEYSGQYGEQKVECTQPDFGLGERSREFGHGGSDFYTMYHFVEKILGNPEADTIDVYEALDMFLPGLFAYRSVLQGGIPMDIPNLRLKEERDRYRQDTACTSPLAAGDQLLPVFSRGNPEIPASVYDRIREKWQEGEKNK